MKKILFRKILFDYLIFFTLALVGTSVIIWIFQAVNFLDLMVEDGRGYLIYINYTLLNFPKIISKILPFVLFFSLTYVLATYELKNEMMIFWNIGVTKIKMINFFLKFSILCFIVQIFLTTIIIPLTQNISRDLIKTSEVNFFESFIKPKKFNDNIKGLTIYADKINEKGNLENIYLKKQTNSNSFQITYAKNGLFKDVGDLKVLELQNGVTINSKNNNITNFNFSKSDFTLDQLDTDIVKVDKLQETSTFKLIKCLKNYMNKDLTIKKNQIGTFFHNCNIQNLDNIFKELYKRFVLPLYIPVLILISLILILKSKENVNYSKYRFIIFIFGFGIMVLSEASLKFIDNTFYSNIKLILMPIITFSLIYIMINIHLKVKR
jgi:lipopolysaccharide export system permease protein